MKRKRNKASRSYNIARLSDDELRGQIEQYMMHFEGVTGSAAPGAANDMMNRISRFRNALKRK